MPCSVQVFPGSRSVRVRGRAKQYILDFFLWISVRTRKLHCVGSCRMCTVQDINETMRLMLCANIAAMNVFRTTQPAIIKSFCSDVKHGRDAAHDSFARLSLPQRRMHERCECSCRQNKAGEGISSEICHDRIGNILFPSLLDDSIGHALNLQQFGSQEQAGTLCGPQNKARHDGSAY